jgi:hypothetical protein
MNQLSVRPTEGSTFIITADFKDADGTAFVPTTCFWTLSDGKGTVINGRLKVPVVPTSSIHTFVLSGEDLRFDVGATKGSRIFTVDATYDSVYGSDLPFRAEVGFTVLNTVV